MVTRIVKLSEEAYSILANNSNGKSLSQTLSEAISKAVNEMPDCLKTSIGKIDVGPLKRPVGIYDNEYNLLKEFLKSNESYFSNKLLRRVGMGEVASVAVVVVFGEEVKYEGVQNR